MRLRDGSPQPEADRDLGEYRKRTCPMPKTNPTPEREPLAPLYRRLRIRAFVVAMLAAFLVICLVFSMQIRGFASSASVTVHVQDTESFSQTLKRLLEQQTDDLTMASIIDQIAEQIPLQNPLMVDRELDALRHRLGIRIEKHVRLPQYRITATFEGKGTDDEAALVHALITNLGEQLSRRWSLVERQRELDNQFAQLNRQLESFSANQETRIENSIGIISEWDQTLSDIYQSVVSLDQELRQTPVTTSAPVKPNDDVTAMENALVQLLSKRLTLLATLNEQHPKIRELDRAIENLRREVDQQRDVESITPFQSVGHETRNAEAVNDVLHRLERIDSQTILDQLAMMRESVARNAIDQRENLATLKTLMVTEIGNVYQVDPIALTNHQPVGGIPSRQGLLALGLLAMVFGLIVARKFQPGKQDQGFESVSEMAEALGVPVVAKLRPVRVKPRSTREIPLANRVVRYSEIALFSLSLLLISTCLFQPTIREAFFQNPFYGLARMSWMFVGG